MAAAAYGSVDDFVKCLSTLSGSYDITGHSIGGAIASIAAAKIASANVIDARQVKLVTFGQPRVGNKAWAAAMENATNAYCCKVNGFFGFPPHCNIFGCNCECEKCDEASDRACCHVEHIGFAQGVCSKKRKRSLQQKDLETLRVDYKKILT
uniref:Lipase_3 domain-containing protein n=1 Tax=Meloidogyne hapla TaxID=6305 RepID=A0A1I8BX51_MELHA